MYIQYTTLKQITYALQQYTNTHNKGHQCYTIL